MPENIQVDADLAISPKTIRGRKGNFQLIINNRDKLAQTYKLKASDPGEICHYKFNMDTVTVNPGGTATVDLMVSFKNAPFIGVLKVCNFTVIATTVTREVKTTEGQLECPAFLPMWASVVFGLVLITIILASSIMVKNKMSVQDNTSPIPITTVENKTSVKGNASSVCNTTELKVAAGSYCTLVIRSDGTLWGWGSNATGQLGNGKKGQTDTPEQIGSDNDWAEISQQHWHTVALKNNGTLWAWGSDEYGQLGDGGSGWASDNTPICRLVPFQVGKDNDWIDASAGGKYTLALKRDGSLWAWGENSYGQLGDGQYRQSQDSHANDKLVPTRIGVDNDWARIFNLGGTSMGIKKDGTLWSWGDNSSRQLGRSSGAYDYDPVPKQIGADTDWILVTPGSWHAIYGLKRNGTIWAWGMGVATDADPLRLIQISGNDWQCISSKGEHVFAFSKSQGWFVWGSNSEGQLGLGRAVTNLEQPTPFPGDNWQNIVAGYLYTIAVKTDGSLWAWGENAQWQLGLRHNNDINTPTMIWK